MRTIILTESTRVSWRKADSYFHAGMTGQFRMFVYPEGDKFEYWIQFKGEERTVESEPIYPDAESAMKAAESQLIQLLAKYGRTVMVSEVKI